MTGADIRGVSPFFIARNLRSRSPSTRTGDGLRGFEVQDADGYVLYFGRPRR